MYHPNRQVIYMVRATMCHCPWPNRMVQVHYSPGRPVRYRYTTALADPCHMCTILCGQLAHPCGMVQCSIGQPVPYRYNMPSANPCYTGTITLLANIGCPVWIGPLSIWLAHV